MNLVELRKAINSLSYADKRELLEALERSAQNHPTETKKELEESKFSKGIYCPHCGCVENVQKYGKQNGVQRYRCKDCGEFFTALSFSVFSKTRKPLATWEKYIECMLDGLSIRKSAEECGISFQTSFVWRHKTLGALSRKMEKETSLKGVIEADETFFRVSYKGSRHLPEGRRAHHRGTKASQRGLSRQQVCVPCAIDRSNFVLSKVCNLGKISTRELTAFYEGKVESGAIFCTD
ncbi:IS1595 family transposase [uncultured Bilophila sp.]|uniref:IS1595 family transposase n=1 Tax=uncultured Bilophila sp. TaxID=529385 RepID=UPI00280BEECA|nr:IS1595 family transposase [uncultured Bilophila sp.]